MTFETNIDNHAKPYSCGSEFSHATENLSK